MGTSIASASMSASAANLQLGQNGGLLAGTVQKIRTVLNYKMVQNVLRKSAQIR